MRENIGLKQGCGAEAVKFLWKWKRTRQHLTFWGAGSESIFHKAWDRDAEAKHFKERSWNRKRLTLYGAGSGSKKYSTASTIHIPGLK